MDQARAPMYEALMKHVEINPISYHVPGHKNGRIFPNVKAFSTILPYDLTEITGLDDLHQPEGAILEAEELAADLYQTDYTFFLVNGSTAGNLAMILSVCGPGDSIIVQRNCHKSAMNGLELAGAKPIFVSPDYDRTTNRYSKLEAEKVIEAIHEHPNAKGIFLTYPDYFGSTFELSKIIESAHHYDMPVLVDEAHGAHFPLSDHFPQSALQLGADLVVHSAHKTLPAMTMGSLLHIQSKYVSYETVKNFLQIVQSSSPSYPIMASLDLARKYAASLTGRAYDEIMMNVNKLREALKALPSIELLPLRSGIDDPLKITLTSDDWDMSHIEVLLNEIGVFPEMVQENQLLLMIGLQTKPLELNWIQNLKDYLLQADKTIKHDTINNETNFVDIQAFDYDYQSLKKLHSTWVDWDGAIGKITASSVIPYPPGIPILLKGERIQQEHVDTILNLISSRKHIQYQGKDLENGIEIFIE
ncbi:aminotransferase class I/II-fold pyridoxal phosphate-dependent enzyme [Filobacillus milosensis]|uniref:Aminotransferase class I/II-fold pyridoxal phosphate-dependent enzyme n=1 Tax=Filobacillus milosensis TaxID=94137 RepID=A0A4Y8IRL6_9BACI|nr:aminotransferase class I/II-fold pyridoxal phosphate-dependent enzyme [Filobacillus milosensis]TFB21060.1 aminotransferase class I/II-fold pyridoxal phosphate-dependent enzyme [Filobacillus milosensis]